MNILGVGIDVGQQPVAQNVGLNTESKLQLSILLDVHQLGLGVLLSSRGSPEHVGVFDVRRLGGRLICLDRKLKGARGTLECLDRIDQVTLAELRRRGDLAFVEGAAEGEDVAIFVDLLIVSNHRCFRLGVLTYVDVEIGVVNVQTVGSLFEVLNNDMVSECSIDN
jgi:hypothetical protein